MKINYIFIYQINNHDIHENLESKLKTEIKCENRVNTKIGETAWFSQKRWKPRKLIQIKQMWYLGDIHYYHIDIQCKTPISRQTATPASFPEKRRNCRNRKRIARVRYQDDKNTYNKNNTRIYSISIYTTVYRNPGCYNFPTLSNEGENIERMRWTPLSLSCFQPSLRGEKG